MKTNTVSWGIWEELVQGMLGHKRIRNNGTGKARLNGFHMGKDATLVPGGLYEEMILVMEEVLDDDQN